MGITGGKIVVAGGLQGDIRVYDLETRAPVGEFATGPGGFLNGLLVGNGGDVWVTDGVVPALWHLTAEQVAAGSGPRRRSPWPRRSPTSASRTTSRASSASATPGSSSQVRGRHALPDRP